MTLSHFHATIKAALASRPHWGYTVSGVALQTHIGGKQIYSVSLVPPATAGSTPLTPESLNPEINALRVDGYKYRGLLVLTFESTLSLPGPAWRVQAHYSI